MRGRHVHPHPALDKARRFQRKQGFADAGGMARRQRGCGARNPRNPRLGLLRDPDCGARVRAQRSGWVLLWLLPKRALRGFSHPSPLPQGPPGPWHRQGAEAPRVPAEPPVQEPSGRGETGSPEGFIGNRGIV